MNGNKLKRLDKDIILLNIKDIDGWEINNDFKSISKTFIFNNFKEAFSWMSYISLEAEKNDHHPEWKNVYNKIIINLSTHDVDGLSNKDFILAKAMDSFYKNFLN